ncbi:MAG TPA: DNA methylase N-4 [Betaproteobacteria bacterium]|nr:DNA methylase N-4 [Betaproteobacteria bacterium]
MALKKGTPDSLSLPLPVIYRFIVDLHPAPSNPRIHAQKQIRQIAESIRVFGFLIPILTDANNQIIAGHGRWFAAQRLGLKEVPTIRIEHLTPDQVRAFSISDNQLTVNSSWDDHLLAEQLQQLSVANLDFSVEITGFDMGEIDFRIESLNMTPAGDVDPADETPISVGSVVSAAGDLWHLGEHRLLCGNSLELATYKRLMAGELADVVFEDPPWNVKVSGHVSGNGKIKHPEFAFASGEMSSSEFTQFLTTAFGLAARFSKDGSIHFQCMDFRHAKEVVAAGLSVYCELKNRCIWVKDRAGLGSLYRSQYEDVYVFKHGKTSHTNNVELGRHGRHRSNVWHFPSALSQRHGEEGDLLAMHPTCKPVRLVAEALLDCSNRGDIVLDGFLGSGTTLIAAQRVGRKCRAIEISPRYVDTAIRRWQADTGQDAIHAESGETFAQHERRSKRLASKVSGPSKATHVRKGVRRG